MSSQGCEIWPSLEGTGVFNPWIGTEEGERLKFQVGETIAELWEGCIGSLQTEWVAK